jgi:hypothetical protein
MIVCHTAVQGIATYQEKTINTPPQMMALQQSGSVKDICDLKHAAPSIGRITVDIQVNRTAYKDLTTILSSFSLN